MDTPIDLQEQQYPIDRAIANALIAATPEHWHVVEMVAEKGASGLRIEISNPEGHPEMIGATNELSEQVLKLHDLFQGFGKSWRRATYRVALGIDNSWSFRGTFDY